MFEPRVLLAAGLSLFVLTCGHGGPIRLRFDEGTTPEERAAVEAVIPDWNAETFDNFQIIVADDGDELVSFVDHIVAGGREHDGRECTDEGTDCARGSWIRIRRGLGPEVTRRVARHELGHAIRNMHHLSPGQAGVMQPTTTADAISEADRALCRAAGACPMVSIRAQAAP